MNWLQKIAQIWDRSFSVDESGTAFIDDVVELYRLSYLYFGVEDRIRNTSDAYMQRFENILSNLRQGIVKIGSGVKSQLVTVFRNWLQEHALLDPEAWSNGRINETRIWHEKWKQTEYDAPPTPAYLVFANKEYARYTNQYEKDVKPDTFLILDRNVDKFPLFKAYCKEIVGYEDDETLTEVYGMPPGEDSEEWIDQLFAGDNWLDTSPLDWMGLHNFDLMRKNLPEEVQAEMAKFIYKEYVYPHWYEYWMSQGIDKTREVIERNYQFLLAADPSNVGGFISAINIGLNTMHQTGSMLDHVADHLDINEDKLTSALSSVTKGKYEAEWKSQLDSLFTPEKIASWLRKIAGTAIKVTPSMKEFAIQAAKKISELKITPEMLAGRETIFGDTVDSDYGEKYITICLDYPSNSGGALARARRVFGPNIGQIIFYLDNAATVSRDNLHYAILHELVHLVDPKMSINRSRWKSESQPDFELADTPGYYVASPYYYNKPLEQDAFMSTEALRRVQQWKEFWPDKKEILDRISTYLPHSPQEESWYKNSKMWRKYLRTLLNTIEKEY